MLWLVIVNVHIPRDLKDVQYKRGRKNCISLGGMSLYVSGHQNIPHVNVRSTSAVMCLYFEQTFFSIRNSWRVEKMQPNFIFLKIQSEYFINAIDSLNNKFFVALNTFNLLLSEKSVIKLLFKSIFNDFEYLLIYSIF